MRASWRHIEALAEFCVSAPGDFAEFGVWQGTSFLPLAQLAADVGKVAHAVDSFQGCAEPTEGDVAPDGTRQYGKGALSVGGSKLFRQLVSPLSKSVRVWEGWVPELLDVMAAEVEALAFVHLDLDQYAPTLATLRWVWPRLSPGGIVCCHDWFADRDYLAAGGVRHWMTESAIEPAGTLPSRHIWFRKER